MEGNYGRDDRFDHSEYDEDDYEDDYDYEESSGQAEGFESNNQQHRGSTQVRDDRPSPQRSTSYFKGSNGFVINGGNFSSVAGNVYKGPPGLSDCWTQRPPPIPQTKSSDSYFENTSNFTITNGNFSSIGGHVFDNSSGPLRPQPPGPWPAGPSQGRRPQRNAPNSNPVFAGGLSPPYPVRIVGQDGPSRGLPPRRGNSPSPNSIFSGGPSPPYQVGSATHGRLQGAAPTSSRVNDPVRRESQHRAQNGSSYRYPEISTSNEDTQPRISRERGGSGQYSGPLQPPTPTSQQFDMDIRVDSRDSSPSIPPEQLHQETIPPTTSTTGQSSGSQHAPVSVDMTIRPSASVLETTSRISNTMRADVEPRPQRADNRPVIAGPAPNREPSPQPAVAPISQLSGESPPTFGNSNNMGSTEGVVPKRKRISKIFKAIAGKKH